MSTFVNNRRNSKPPQKSVLKEAGNSVAVRKEAGDAAPARGRAKKTTNGKHPLENAWTLWFFKNDRSRRWKENLSLVSTFKTVEDFWSIHHHLQIPTKLQAGCDYNLFKSGIQPMWEDPLNKDGGKWQVQFPHSQTALLDNLWLETLLMLIGENLGEFSEYINGAVVQIRPKGNKLSIWISNVNDRRTLFSIGDAFKERLLLPKHTSFSYLPHENKGDYAENNHFKKRR